MVPIWSVWPPVPKVIVCFQLICTSVFTFCTTNSNCLVLTLLYSNYCLVVCPPAPECDKSRCQLVSDAHGCPFCSCPPVVHPPPTFVKPRMHLQIKVENLCFLKLKQCLLTQLTLVTFEFVKTFLIAQTNCVYTSKLTKSY